MRFTLPCIPLRCTWMFRDLRGPQKGDCFRDKRPLQVEWTLLCCNGYFKLGGETRQNGRVAGVPDKANHAVRRGRKAKGLAHTPEKAGLPKEWTTPLGPGFVY